MKKHFVKRIIIGLCLILVGFVVIFASMYPDWWYLIPVWVKVSGYISAVIGIYMIIFTLLNNKRR